RMLQRWAKRPDPSQPLDVALEMRRLTLEIIAKILFDAEFEDESDRLTEAITVLMGDIGALSSMVYNFPIAFSPSRHSRFQNSMAEVEAWVEKIVAERRQSSHGANPFMEALLNGKDQETGGPLTALQIRDEVVSM